MTYTRTIVPALALLSFLSVPGIALARSGPAWTYVEAGYSDVSLDDPNDDGNGWFASGSLGIAKHIHVFARYEDDSTDDTDLDLTRWVAGAGWHGLLGEKADVLGDVAWVDADYDVESDSGYFARVGVRWRPIKLFEAGATSRWEDVGDVGDDFVWQAHAMVYVWRVSVGASWETQQDADRYDVFARFNFGGR